MSEGQLDSSGEARSRSLERVRRLAALSETSVRAGALGESFAALEPYEAVEMLEQLVRGAVTKDGACLAVYAALIDPDPLHEALGHDRLAVLTAAAQEHGCVAALQWLWWPSARERRGAVNADKLVHKDLRHLTLGHRRALARRANGDTLMKLLADPDPQVIANLLNNPRTTESTVLAVCARRPTVSPALEAVLRSSRWSHRYRVRLALARNPHLEERFAVNLLACLDRPDLESVRDDETLSASLRLSAQRLLELCVV